MALRNMARPALVVAILALGVLSLPLAAHAQERPWEQGGAIPMLWWPLILIAAALVVGMLVVWGLLHLTPIVLLLIGAVFGLRWLFGGAQHRASDRALEILRERYARGELSKDEFEARRRDLNSS